MKIPFGMPIFRGYVSFREGTELKWTECVLGFFTFVFRRCEDVWNHLSNFNLPCVIYPFHCFTIYLALSKESIPNISLLCARFSWSFAPAKPGSNQWPGLVSCLARDGFGRWCFREHIDSQSDHAAVSYAQHASDFYHCLGGFRRLQLGVWGETVRGPSALGFCRFLWTCVSGFKGSVAKDQHLNYFEDLRASWMKQENWFEMDSGKQGSTMISY